MIKIDTFAEQKIAQEVDRICRYFLKPRKISYFQFKRTYKNGTSIILANDVEFFKEFLENGFVAPLIHLPINTRQSSFCFWDETLSKAQLNLLTEKQGVYHGLTILSSRKVFYDCTTYAMSEPHPSPVGYYFHILKDLQDFSTLFPLKAQQLIKEANKMPLKSQGSGKHNKRNSFFLPKRSARFYIGEDVNNYITTYEALCAQLIQEGKSYKEIGTILSMASSTVKTHLIRLKARTGLSLQEIFLQSFKSYNNNKNIFKLNNHIKPLIQIKAKKKRK